MKAFKALGLAMALVAALFVANTGSAGAASGGFSCTSSTGSVHLSPGLLLKTSRPQSISLSSTVACTGGFVDGGAITAKVQSTDVRCAGFVNTTSSGTATAVWSTPGMGKTTMKFSLRATATTGHTTTGTVHGFVTTNGSALASGHSVVGTFAINKGLHSTLRGGDCTVTIPLTSASLTALAFHTI